MEFLLLVVVDVNSCREEGPPVAVMLNVLQKSKNLILILDNDLIQLLNELTLYCAVNWSSSPVPGLELLLIQQITSYFYFIFSVFKKNKQKNRETPSVFDINVVVIEGSSPV